MQPEQISDGRIGEDEVREGIGSNLTKDIGGHRKDFGFYSE